MRRLHRLLGAAFVIGCTATPVVAQSGTITTSGGQSTGSLSGTGGLAGSPGGTGSNAMGGGNNNNPASANNDLSQSLSSLSGISAPGAGGGTTSSAISSSNFLSTYYGNPYYQGLLSNASTNSGKGVPPGGFGNPLFGNTGGTGGGMIGSAAGAGGARAAIGGAGARGGQGGLGGLGGRGGANSGTNSSGMLIQQPIAIMHPAIATFPVAPVVTSQLQADITGMISRSPAIANPAGVSVAVDRGIVRLTGTVRDIEEARTIAGMIRLAPGVRKVLNDLTFPKP